MKEALFLWMVFSLFVGISSQHDTYNQRCIDCLYYKKDNLPGPELLFATSSTAVLRARSCHALCQNMLRWYYQIYEIGNGIKLEEKNCSGRDYCTFGLRLPGTQLFVNTALYNNRTGNFTESGVTYVKVCPVSPPPAPPHVECLRSQEKMFLRWQSSQDTACTTSTQYMVRMEYQSRSMKDWLWLGEVFMRGEQFVSFAGHVRRCESHSVFLCADLDPNVEHFMTRVQLGVRRIDAYNRDEMMSKTFFFKCYEDQQPAPPGTVASSTSPYPTNFPEAEPSASPNPAKGNLRHAMSTWRTMALGSLAALIITIIMLPLAFVAGRRYQVKQRSCNVSWRHLSEDGLASRADHSPLPCHGDFPPAYAYDYAVPVPVLPPPPLPPNHPPPRVRSAQEEPNDMYGLEEFPAGGPSADVKRLR